MSVLNITGIMLCYICFTSPNSKFSQIFPFSLDRCCLLFLFPLPFFLDNLITCQFPPTVQLSPLSETRETRAIHPATPNTLMARCYHPLPHTQAKFAVREYDIPPSISLLTHTCGYLWHHLDSILWSFVFFFFWVWIIHSLLYRSIKALDLS